MIHLCDMSCNKNKNTTPELGPLVEGGTPYSAILRSSIGIQNNKNLDPIPSELTKNINIGSIV